MNVPTPVAPDYQGVSLKDRASAPLESVTSKGNVGKDREYDQLDYLKGLLDFDT